MKNKWVAYITDSCMHLQKSNITREDLFPARLQEKAYFLKFPVSRFYNLGAANDHKEHNSLPY